MTRIIDYKIEEKDADKTVGLFLKEKGYSRGVVIELKKSERGITKNGQWVTVKERLKAGDHLVITLIETCDSEQIEPVYHPLEILFEDEDLLVVNKPAHMPVHPSINNYGNTLANAVQFYFKEKGASHVFRCINRLDRDTTGITIIAKNLLAASKLSGELMKHRIRREYIALVEGELKGSGTIDLPIGRAEGSIIKRKVDYEKGEHAITHYQSMGIVEIKGKKITQVRLDLETGRTHQIRVHMSGSGYPLVGDFLYNDEPSLLQRQALHGVKCTLSHPITEEEMVFETPLPKDMAHLLVR